jgi:hypothetical protein
MNCARRLQRVLGIEIDTCVRCRCERIFAITSGFSMLGSAAERERPGLRSGTQCPSKR